MTGHTDWVRAVVPLSDGRVLLATGGSDCTVRLWDPTTGNTVGDPLTGHSGWVLAVAVVPLSDGRVLLATGGADRTVRLWDPVTGSSVGDPLTGHTGPVWAVAAVPLLDGRVLLAAGSADGMVRLWDPIDATELTRVVTAASVQTVCASPADPATRTDGFLAIGGPAGIAVLDIDPVAQ